MDRPESLGFLACPSFFPVMYASLLTVSMGLVYVRVQNSNRSSAHIYALNPGTGALLWRSPLLQLNLTTVYPVNGALSPTPMMGVGDKVKNA